MRLADKGVLAAKGGSLLPRANEAAAGEEDVRSAEEGELAATA